jgi:hypothetical protein
MRFEAVIDSIAIEIHALVRATQEDQRIGLKGTVGDK